MAVSISGNAIGLLGLMAESVALASRPPGTSLIDALCSHAGLGPFTVAIETDGNSLEEDAPLNLSDRGVFFDHGCGGRPGVSDDDGECLAKTESGNYGRKGDRGEEGYPCDACVIEEAGGETDAYESDPDVRTAVAVLLALKWHEGARQVTPETPEAGTKRARATEEYRCARCGTSKTPLWRKTPGTEIKLCNACGIYLKTHGQQRPKKWFRMN